MAFGLSAGAISLIGAGVGALGSMAGSSGSTQTADRSPWSEAQPWIKNNIASGQALQSQYAANPFNAAQIQGYGNQAATGDYIRNNLGTWLAQLQGQGGGFDRSNPSARPAGFTFGGSAGNLGMGPSYGSASPALASSLMSAAAPAAAPATVLPTKAPIDLRDWGYDTTGWGGGA
jgi:hypothetical protein